MHSDQSQFSVRERAAQPLKRLYLKQREFFHDMLWPLMEGSRQM